MAYQKILWVDEVTPLSADNMNHIEQGIYDVDQALASKADLVGGKVPTSQLPSLDFIPTSQKGVANGVATLDDSGQVPSSQLPSYVDDVIEFAKQVSGSSFMTDTLATDPGTRVWCAAAKSICGEQYYRKFLVNVDGTEANLIVEEPEGGKIYVGKTDTNCYRWTGSNLVEISKSIGLNSSRGAGTTTTAYRSDFGKQNYEDILALQSNKLNKNAYSDTIYRVITNKNGNQEDIQLSDDLSVIDGKLFVVGGSGSITRDGIIAAKGLVLPLDTDTSQNRTIPMNEYGWHSGVQNYAQKNIKIGDGLVIDSNNSLFVACRTVVHTRWIYGGEWSDTNMLKHSGKYSVTLRIANACLVGSAYASNSFSLYVRSSDGTNVQVAKTMSGVLLQSLYEITIICDNIGSYSKFAITYKNVANSSGRPTISNEFRDYLDIDQSWDLWDKPGNIYFGYSSTESSNEVPIIERSIYNE